MMFGFKYGCLYDLRIAIIKLLPLFIATFVCDEWYDRVSHSRVLFFIFYVHMGFGMNDMYVFWDE